MTGILLTKTTTFIIGPVATLLGYLMTAIFTVLEKVGIPNIGLAIIIFTIVIYLFMTPLTIKQQKFSKLSAKMNPEIQAIQAKFKNKKDNDSVMMMNQETQAVYKKYGVSPTGSCLQLLIQMPILLALYRVIYNFPAYVAQVKEAFYPLVDNLRSQVGSIEFLNNTENFANVSMFTKQFTSEAFLAGDVATIQNTFIDVLNKASSAEWSSLADKFPSLSTDITNTLNTLNNYNNFLGLNMADSPSFMVKQALDAGSWLLVVGALAIPVLSALTQWINVKLMPQAAEQMGGEQNTMASSMKTMNMIMPFMSAFFCYTLPAGMGLYWVAGSVVRSIQQIVINKHIDKIDLDELIKKNVEKQNEKMKKAGIDPKTINNNAHMSTKSAGVKKIPKSTMSQSEKDEAMKKATDYYSKNAKPGSIASKANMVKQFNEKNNK